GVIHLVEWKWAVDRVVFEQEEHEQDRYEHRRDHGDIGVLPIIGEGQFLHCPEHEKAAGEGQGENEGVDAASVAMIRPDRRPEIIEFFCGGYLAEAEDETGHDREDRVGADRANGIHQQLDAESPEDKRLYGETCRETHM